MVWPQPHTLGLNPPESVCQPDLEIDYGNPARSYPQVDSPPVFSPQSSNCSSENCEQDGWFTLDNSQCHPPFSQENPPTEAGPPETMAEEQSLTSQLTESWVVMAEELARLLQELQSVRNTLADECDYVVLVSKAYEKAFQLLLACTNRLHNSIRQLQAVVQPSCSPTQFPSDSSLTQAKDVHGSHINLNPFPGPHVDGIPKCQDTPIPDGSSERLALLGPKPKPCLSLQKDVLQQLDVPWPDLEPKLSLKRTSEVYTSPDAIIHQDSPVHSTASGDVHCGSKCTSVHHDREISVSDEDEICIPSHTSLPDLKDTPSSLTTKAAVCCFDSSLAHASGMGYKHSTQHDIKSPPPDEVGLNSPLSSVCTVSPKGPLSVDKLARVKSMSSPHNLCIRLDADEKEECLLCMGDRLLGEESVHEYMAVPLITQDSIDQSPNNA